MTPPNSQRLPEPPCCVVSSTSLRKRPSTRCWRSELAYNWAHLVAGYILAPLDAGLLFCRGCERTHCYPGLLHYGVLLISLLSISENGGSTKKAFDSLRLTPRHGVSELGDCFLLSSPPLTPPPPSSLGGNIPDVMAHGAHLATYTTIERHTPANSKMNPDVRGELPTAVYTRCLNLILTMCLT